MDNFVNMAVIGVPSENFTDVWWDIFIKGFINRFILPMMPYVVVGAILISALVLVLSF